MTQSSFAASPAVAFFRLLKQYPWRWILPTILMTVLAVGYAFIRKPAWEASQAVLVRDDAFGFREGSGEFDSAEEMKKVEETLLEVVRTHDLLADVLRQVGPPEGTKPTESWPSEEDIVELREAIAVKPPKGFEFGSTEIFYITVEQAGSKRAVTVANAVFEQLKHHSQAIRNAKAQSLILELKQASDLVRVDLNKATDRLATMEAKIGADLGELRAINVATSGSSSMQNVATQIRSERRRFEADLGNNEQLLAMLEAVQKDPKRLLDTPNRLLTSQPALRQLKDGLISAQLATARLQGTQTDVHPEVEAAREAETAIRAHLRQELGAAIRSLKTDIKQNRRQIEILETRLADNTERQANLARQRAAYDNLTDEVDHHVELLKQANEKLAQARAAEANAAEVSLIEPIGSPDPGIYPVGPSRAVIVVMGLAGGLFLGIGIIFLTAPHPSVPSSPFESKEPWSGAGRSLR